MIVVGLTGSIGMGKSTAARVLRRLGVPVYDADGAVHRLLARGGAAVDVVGRAFPGVLDGGTVDRQELGRRVFGDPAKLARLEQILHPLVRRDSVDFLRRCALQRRPVAVLDVPLLFETGRDRDCDSTVLVTAPVFIQTQRVMRRPGMTLKKLREIRSRQMPDREKRRRADFVVLTGLGRRESLRKLMHIVRLLRTGRARRSPRARWIPQSARLFAHA